MKSIGRYEIRSMLGKGGMGRVYKVVIPGLDKIAAVKSLAPSPKLMEAVGRDQLREQFIQEAVIIANIRHPNVVDIWSLEETDGHLFYVMEYFCHNLGVLIGEAYWADIPTRIIRVEKAAQYTLAVLQGLARLHHAGIIHRDIKPFNIMLTDMETVKIVDFGLSRRRGETARMGGDLLIGTGFYAAPEQVAAPEAADHRADLYSAGVMLYRLVTGRLPGPDPEPPGRWNPHLDKSWDLLIKTALAPNPEDRFVDASRMADAVQEALFQYRKNREAVCAVSESSFLPADGEKGAAVSLRADPGRVLAKHGRSLFEINELYRPETYVSNQFVSINADCIADQATGLIWQQAGSEYPIDWDRAQAYIRQINAQAFGGYTGWRLPTVNELLSLLNPPPPEEDFCFASPFSSVQKWIWSGDTRSARASWLVNLEMGFVMSSDVTDCFYVRAVRRLTAA